MALAATDLPVIQAADSAVLEAHKALVHRLFAEGINGRDLGILTELYAGAAVDRGARARQMPGPLGLPLTLDEFRAAFPDLTVTVDAVIAEADLVATRETWWGTHPPVGMHVVGRTMHLFRIANEQIVEQWSSGWEWLARRDSRPEPRPSNPLAMP